ADARNAAARGAVRCGSCEDAAVESSGQPSCCATCTGNIGDAACSGGGGGVTAARPATCRGRSHPRPQGARTTSAPYPCNRGIHKAVFEESGGRFARAVQGVSPGAVTEYP